MDEILGLLFLALIVCVLTRLVKHVSADVDNERKRN